MATVCVDVLLGPGLSTWRQVDIAFGALWGWVCRVGHLVLNKLLSGRILQAFPDFDGSAARLVFILFS